MLNPKTDKIANPDALAKAKKDKAFSKQNEESQYAQKSSGGLFKIIFIIVAIFGVGSYLYISGKINVEDIMAKFESMTNKKAAKKAPANWRNTAVKKKDEGAANPVQSLIESMPFNKAKEEASTVLTVQGISFDPGGRSLVTVAGQLIPVGGKIGDWTVVNIRLDSVDIDIEGVVKMFRVGQALPLAIKQTDAK